MDPGFNPQARWGEKVIDRGYVCIPNLLIENVGNLGLTPTEFTVLVAIDKFRWYGGKMPYPSNKTLSLMLGLSESTIKRTTRSLAKKKMLIKNRSYNNSNHYDFELLLGKLHRIA